MAAVWLSSLSPGDQEVPRCGEDWLVSTTTASLVLLHQTAQGPVYRRLSAPAGLLGGLGLEVGEEGHSNVLVAATNQHDQPNSVHYFIVQFRTLTAASPISHSQVTMVPSLSYTMAEAGEPKQFRLMRLGEWCYVYSKERVTMVSLSPGEESPGPSHISCRILGAGQAENAPLFFSSPHRVISLTPRVQEPSQESPSLSDTSRTKLCDSLNVLVSAAGLENLTMPAHGQEVLRGGGWPVGEV